MNTYSSSSNRPCEGFQLQTGGSLPAPGPVHRHNGAVGVESRKHGLPLRAGAPKVEPRQARACKPLPAVSTLLYFPLKAAFAIGGGIVGGFAYVFSGGNEQAAKSIWDTSLCGTYIITPDHLQGNRPIRFLGVADSNDAPHQPLLRSPSASR